jgi:hypothetical protein
MLGRDGADGVREGEWSEWKKNPNSLYLYPKPIIRPRLGLLGLGLFGGGPYSVPTSKNRFMEVGILIQPPSKIDYLWKATASINPITQAVDLTKPPPLID